MPEKTPEIREEVCSSDIDKKIYHLYCKSGNEQDSCKQSIVVCFSVFCFFNCIVHNFPSTIVYEHII